MADRRFFLCTGNVIHERDLFKHPAAHIIGHLLYLYDEGRRVTALARWAVSPPARQDPPIAPDVDVYLIGDARRIKCRYAGCPRHQRWELGRAGFLALLERYGKVDDLLRAEAEEEAKHEFIRDSA